MKKLFLLVPLIAMLLLGGFTFAPELNPQAYAELKAGDRVTLYFQTPEAKIEQRAFIIVGESGSKFNQSLPMLAQQDLEYLLTEAVKELYPSVIPESMRFAIE